MTDKTIIGIHTILSSTPQQGSSAELADGHAWITITRDGVTQQYGLWPDNHPRGLDNGPESDIRVGIEGESVFNPPTASRYIELTPEQAKKLEESLKENVEWGYTNTCASWASETYSNVTGEKIDASEYLITDTPRELTKSINALERQYPTSLDKPHPPIEQKKSSWNLFGENSSTNGEVKELYATLQDGLSEKIEKAGAGKFSESMLSATTLACVENGLTADKIDRMGINTQTNTIFASNQWGTKMATVDAFAAAKVNPQETLQQASQLQDNLSQQHQERSMQMVQQQEQKERAGPSFA